MNNNIIQNSIDDESRKHIKEVVKQHYGFIPTDEEIDRLDKELRISYEIIHPYRIINMFATFSLDKVISKYREKLGIKLEEMELDKLIFKYRTYAKMCFHNAIPYATICLCRIAIEAGVREKIAEELAEKDKVGNKNLSDKILEQMKKLKNITLGSPNGGLFALADKNCIITREEVEQMFKNRFRSRNGRKILDKFIHGDIFDIYDFQQKKGVDTRVIGAKDKLEELKIISDSASFEIAFEVLRITTEIAEILYLKT